MSAVRRGRNGRTTKNVYERLAHVGATGVDHAIRIENGVEGIPLTLRARNVARARAN